ncbi:MAG: hypothetical protein AB7G47_14700 [Mycolicibacterium sp.]|uniref:hypothetical protein n=1 Tax=Mycolicibacterium sp. TaxID=2320850 RepID=UPI003D0BADFC
MSVGLPVSPAQQVREDTFSALPKIGPVTPATPVPVPVWAWVLAAIVVAWIAYALMGSSLDLGAWNALHEFFHDGRHLLAVPCH